MTEEQERPVLAGRHHRIDGPINEPKGAGGRKPSLRLGGGGEKVTLKLVAKYADGCNVGNGDPALIERKLAVPRGHCDEQGTGYDRIIKSTSLSLEPGDSTAKARERVDRIAAAGADHVVVYIPRVAYDHAPLLAVAEGHSTVRATRRAPGIHHGPYQRSNGLTDRVCLPAVRA